MATPKLTITVSEYLRLRDEDEGYCTRCRAFTTSGVEPDAEGFPCEVCGHRTVIGAEDALIRELIDVDGD